MACGTRQWKVRKLQFGSVRREGRGGRAEEERREKNGEEERQGEAGEDRGGERGKAGRKRMRKSRHFHSPNNFVYGVNIFTLLAFGQKEQQQAKQQQQEQNNNNNSKS